jgi:fatty-acyl-CoA synthase
MKSYLWGPAKPLLEKTIFEVFSETAARHAAREALVSRHQNLRLTWRELEQEVERTARGLWGLGIRPGDRVGMWASSRAEWVYLQLAVARIGAVLVNVNPAYRSHELRYVLGKSRMKAVFLAEKDSRANYLEILEEARSGQDIALRHVVLLGAEPWRRMIENGAPPPPTPAGPDEVTNIQYTSGTTGAPKGCLLTHRNLVNNALRVGGCLRLTHEDRICVPVPLYHCFGCVMASLAAVDFGNAIVLPAATFDPGETLRAIESERCTVVYGVPTMFIAELEHPEFPKFNLTSLRTGIMAGAPCPIELMRRVVNEMHCREIVIAYGQTESSPAITMSLPEDDLAKRVSTVGTVLPDTEVKIVDPNGSTVEIGEQGEFCTRGYLVMKGYDDDPEATAAAIDREGWLHTGDLATMRPDGYFRITGRAREMIIRGGENIYPREIEEFLHTHPKIADVAVFGLPDIRVGETVAAWVRLRAGETATEEDIRAYCSGRLAHFKIPQYVRFVTDFPMTVTGKVQKFRMRQVEIGDRGLEAAARVETA